MSHQILGGYKEFLIIRREELDEIEKLAKQKLNSWDKSPLSESHIEAKAVLDVVNWIKEHNIYNQGLEIKK